MIRVLRHFHGENYQLALRLPFMFGQPKPSKENSGKCILFLHSIRPGRAFA